MTPRQRKHGGGAAVRRRSDTPTQSAADTAPREIAPREQVSLKQEFKAHIGPIPDPDALRSYETTLPGAADRILGIFESQTSHRVNQETTWLRGNLRKDTRGQWFTIITIFGVLGFGAFLATTGTPSIGVPFMVVGLLNWSLLILRKVGLLSRTPGPKAHAPVELPGRPTQESDDPADGQRAG